MATITLDYNSRNAMAQKTLNYILSLGIFREKTMEKEDKVDFWNTLSCEQQKDIEAGIININNREVIDYETFMTKHRQ
ncbi:MAG: hypothetical protein FWF65_00515 [Bacteroidetes bacterium]|nr:hypothetical protein [Bacteroidota bacterium]